jgi:hypothetical protein
MGIAERELVAARVFFDQLKPPHHLIGPITPNVCQPQN